MKGRPPKTREERMREGSTKRLPEPVRLTTRAQAADLAEPPLKLSPPARAWWDDVVVTLTDAGVIERVDRYLVAMAAAAYGDVVKMDAVIAEFGMFDEGSTGQVREAPWVKVRREAMLTYEKLCNHIAVSPVARARLGLAVLAGNVMAQEMDELLDVPDAEVIEDEAVGLPGV